jgi:hypothetical protein
MIPRDPHSRVAIAVVLGAFFVLSGGVLLICVLCGARP